MSKNCPHGLWATPCLNEEYYTGRQINSNIAISNQYNAIAPPNFNAFYMEPE